MVKLRQTSSKSRVNNYRVEKYKIDKYGDQISVQVGCYISNTEGNLKSLGAIVRNLNGLCGRKTLELKEYDLKPMFIVEVPDCIVTKGWGYSTITSSINLNNVGHHLDELAFDVLSDAIIDVYENSNVVVMDK